MRDWVVQQVARYEQIVRIEINHSDHIIQSERLTVPHYDMYRREFVIIPLAEIAPHLSLPSGQSIQMLAQKFADHQMVIVKHKNEIHLKN